jgi:hypothetical protein
VEELKMTSITTREYNPTTGALIGNVSSLNFGKIAAGSHTAVKVIDFIFSGLTTVSNIKVGILSSTLEVNESPTDVQADGSSSNGAFGLMHTDAFNKDLATSSLGRHVAGLNLTGLSSDAKNVLIGNKSSTVSQFIYLDMELGGNNLGVFSGTYKVFFDFE